MITVRQTKNLKLIKKLNDRIFPSDPLTINPLGVYWVAKDNDFPVGFCALHPLAYERGCVFLARAGVIKSARGKGLHRKLINVRLNWCRKNDIQTAITYTLDDNLASANNLVRCGLTIYNPQHRWADSEQEKEVLYFRIDF